MITNITAYRINGEYYLHNGKPNANTKKKIQRRIKENQEAKKQGEIQTSIHSYSFVDGWQEEKTKPSQKRTTNKN